MDGLEWKTLLKWDDLGAPLFLETPICMDCTFASSDVVHLPAIHAPLPIHALLEGLPNTPRSLTWKKWCPSFDDWLPNEEEAYWGIFIISLEIYFEGLIPKGYLEALYGVSYFLSQPMDVKLSLGVSWKTQGTKQPKG